MRIGAAVGGAILGGLVIVACGSSSSDGGSTARACTPGASVACTGAGGCSGGQVCNASGTAFGDCVCGAGTDGGPSPSDAGSDAGSDANSKTDSAVDSGPGWTPLNLSALELWTEASDVTPTDGGTITGWPNLAPDAGTFGALSASNLQVVPASIHGVDALQFTSAGFSTALASGALLPSTDNFLVELVADPGACGAQCQLWAEENDDTYPIPPAVNVIVTTTQTTVTATMAEPNPGTGTVVATGSASFTAGPHIIGLRRTSATAMELRIDGTATAFTVPSNMTVTISPDPRFLIGTFDGTVAEVVIATTPTAADVTNLESYLKSKYGL